MQLAKIASQCAADEPKAWGGGGGGRGRVAEGAFADLVVFDAERIEDTATYADPKREARGIEWVIVNGRVALERGRHTGAGAGRALRYRAEPEERSA